MIIKVVIFLLILFCFVFVLAMCKAAGRRDGMEEEINGSVSCKDCVYDVPDEDNLSWQECAAPGEIPEEIFERYDDNELPKHCGYFKRRQGGHKA
jgi:hypothetical protein